MIPFGFSYLRPDTLAEAVAAHRAFAQAGKAALYYGGGSEIITMSRVGAIRPDAVIDVKNIPELNVLSSDHAALTLGAALTLNRIKESKLFPLMTLACGRIADHTNQCRITLGGNLCGSIIYRETSLPLLLADAEVAAFGPEGERKMPFRRVFDGRMRLKPGELLTQVRVPGWALSARHAHIKKTARDKIDYPLVNVTALLADDVLRCAFSGISDAPFRSAGVEAILNDRNAPAGDRAARAAAALSACARGDAEASREFRLFAAKNTLKTLLEGWEDGSIWWQPG
jgi:CO/xanthine dehydrogenase FAD-binding subunit